jgi:hypothetical protein
MKMLKLFCAVTLLSISMSCKDHTNEQGKGEVTETGQNIGASADSTTVDGEKGSMSNN